MRTDPDVTFRHSLPAGQVGVPYAGSVQAWSESQGLSGWHYSVAESEDALPDGLEINATTGEVTGTPTEAVTRTCLFKGYDGNGNNGAQYLCSIVIAPA